MGKGKRIKLQRRLRQAAERTPDGGSGHGPAASPWDTWLDARAQGRDADALAGLALTPFRVTETGPGALRREPWEARLGTLARERRMTVADLAEFLRSEVAAGRLRWDADALLATVEVKPELNLVLIDDVLRVYPHRYVFDARCVAKTSAGKRCRNTLAHSQPGPWSVWELPGEKAAYVQGFDLDGPDLFVGRDGTAEALKARFLKQRCFLHRDSTEVAAAPEWEMFDLDVRRPRLWLLDHRRLAGANILPLPWLADVAQAFHNRRSSVSTMECTV
ncbi:hypothetical protein [Saccharothrix sp. ALI-22-I]|uniref:hypothetical protein n=1 Tax=Saccharothrix sp. ALI-22-I TaxID=1933778 RepID=UPI00117A1D1E|nr:hypothetical protein [Saccharothrix sp. ALI-22-I]